MPFHLILAVESKYLTQSLCLFQVVAPINKLIETTPFDLICYSLDWHPADHISFVENVAMRQLDPSSAVSYSPMQEGVTEPKSHILHCLVIRFYSSNYGPENQP